MSILVKGMTMPKNCDVCFLRDACEYAMPLGKRVIDCPLIELPPHGRLLDVDDVFNVLTSYYHHSTDFQREALKEALARVSTIIEAEDGGSDDKT